jgi:hypothetical protein
MELRMRKHIALGTVMALGIGAQAVAAEGLSYNNIDLSYVDGQIDGGEGFDLDGDGFLLEGSVGLGERLFVLGSFGSLNLDGAKLKPLSLGLGGHLPLGMSVDVVGALSFERLKLEGAGSESGWGASVGLRGKLGDSFELNGAIKHVDIGDFGSDMEFTVGGRYYFTDAFAVGVDFTKWDDLDLQTWGIALRYDFGM